MSRTTSNPVPRYLARAAALAGCVLAVSVCGEQGRFPTTPTGGTGGGSSSDVTPPVVLIVLPTPPHDTIQDITDSLKFTVADTDNVKLKSVQLTVSGLGFTYSFIDSANVGVAGFSKPYTLPLKHGSPGNHVIINAIALDATGNLGQKVDTIKIVDQKAPVLAMTAPAGSTTIGAGGTLKVVSSASDPSGIKYMGARVFTVNNLNQRVVLVANGKLVADSNIYPAAPATAVPLNKTDTILVPIPASVTPGSYLLQTFARDSSNTPNDTVSASANLQVVTVLPPSGLWVFPPQDTAVVAGDSLKASFDAKDSAGVQSISFTAYSVHGDSSLGTFTTTQRFSAIGAAMTAPLPKDTTIARFFKATADSTVDSVFLSATVTNIGGLSATIRRRIQVIKGPFVQVLKPVAGARLPTGLPPDSITLIGYAPALVKWLGFTARGVAAAGDSTVFATPAVGPDTVVRFLSVPATTALGVDTIVPFVRTAAGLRFTGKPVLITFADTVRPADTVLLPVKSPILTVAVGDSVFVKARVLDNRGVTNLTFSGVARRGSVSLGTDSVVTRYTPRTVKLPQVADTTITRYLRASTPLDSTGEFVFIIATATDSSGNTRADTSQVRVVSGPRVSVITPNDGAVTSPTKSLTIQVHAKGSQGVHILGYRITGVFTLNDSTFGAPVNGVLSDTLTFTKTITIPALTPLGTFNITAFAVDSTGNPSATIAGVNITVQSLTATDNVPPLVQFSVPLRVEAGDSLTVTATDPSGITKVGFIVRDTAGTILHGDSVTFGGTGTFVSQKFRLGLDTITTFPRVVKVEAFGVDGATAPNRGVSVAPSSITPAGPPTQAFQDTLTVVAGTTIALPQGGQFGDAIVNPNRNELYLTNTLLDQIEVFNLGTNTFGSPIRVGSQPVGIALWPSDTLGANLNKVVVANSGGTNLSIVDVAAGVELSRRAVPNWSLSTVKTTTNAGGGKDTVITSYELADRPQYLGTTCRRGGVTACDSVIVVYSTTPTGAQPSPFPGKGYVAWENITAPVGQHGAGHLFYEQASRGTSQDTLLVVAVRDTSPGVPIRDIEVGVGAGIIANISQIAFQDSTFVRNSGNFVHALMGEGGLNQGFARALMYDASRGVATVAGTGCNPALVTCQAQVDSGVSPAVYVSDFLVNHASRVLSVATNFNGRTNLIRADSIYAFDRTLKLTGLLQLPSGKAGMDFDPNNAFDAATKTSGTLNKKDRLVFAARPDAGIDVFDTYWYQRVATVPIRDTIIGPIRVASSGGTLILAGVTSRGVVVVRLPNLTNPFPVSPMRPVTTLPASPRRALGARP